MKKIITIILLSIILFLFHFPTHFMYDWFPNSFTYAFFPINESIFQHIKMMFTSTFLFYLFLFLIRKKTNNISLINLISFLACLSLFLILYLPLYKAWGENLFITLLLLFISILYSQWITYFLYKSPNYKILNIISFILIICIFIINIFLTRFPLNHYLFYY